MSKRKTFRQRLERMARKIVEEEQPVARDERKFGLGADWWRTVVWEYGSRCNGWTLWQIYKNDPTYLNWIKDNFTFRYDQGNLVSAIDAAVEFKEMREQEER